VDLLLHLVEACPRRLTQHFRGAQSARGSFAITFDHGNRDALRRAWLSSQEYERVLAEERQLGDSL
jgi:hypothetical protein